MEEPHCNNPTANLIYFSLRLTIPQAYLISRPGKRIDHKHGVGKRAGSPEYARINSRTASLTSYSVPMPFYTSVTTMLIA